MPVFANTSFIHRAFLVSLSLALTGLIYFNSLKNGFVFDDEYYIVNNYLIKVLDSQGLWNMFSSFYRSDYLPVTFLSLSIDYWLYGLNPAGYHFSNTLLHFINALLVYQLVLRTTKSGTGAFWASLIFLVHPVQVESVAWIAERKNLLSFFFFSFSFLTYLNGGTRPFSLLLFLLACLAKSSVVILPQSFISTGTAKRWFPKITISNFCLMIGRLIANKTFGRGLRLFIAVVLLTTGLGKALDIPGFVEVLITYQALADWMLYPVALGTTATELITSFWLFSGRLVFWAALASLGLHVVFTLWTAVTFLRGLDIPNCGCFGVFFARPLDGWTIVEDLVMVAFSGLLIVSSRMDKK